MNAQKIAILTDSGTNVPKEFVKAHDVRIIPLLINYTDGTYQSDVDITSDEVARRMETEVPTTSLPSPSTILKAFEQAKADGYERAVCVTISSGLSATNQTCHMVASQMEGFPVEVIDTKSIGVAAGMVVMDAALLVENNVPFDQLAGRLNALAEQTWVLFSVDQLGYLRRGGRITEAQYRLGSALNIKPIFDCDEEGRYRTVKRCRGRAKALKAMVDMIVDRSKLYGSVVCAVATAGQDAPDPFVADFKERIGDLAGVITSRITPDLLVHTGPTLIGMAIQPAIPEMQALLAQQSY